MRDTQIHIAKNLRWSVLTKIMFFFSPLIVMDSFIIGVWVQKNSTGARNRGCNSKSGRDREGDHRELWAFLAELEATASWVTAADRPVPTRIRSATREFWGQHLKSSRS